MQEWKFFEGNEEMGDLWLLERDYANLFIETDNTYVKPNLMGYKMTVEKIDSNKDYLYEETEHFADLSDAKIHIIQKYQGILLDEVLSINSEITKIKIEREKTDVG
jgi:hypothetical protein